MTLPRVGPKTQDGQPDDRAAPAASAALDVPVPGRAAAPEIADEGPAGGPDEGPRGGAGARTVRVATLALTATVLVLTALSLSIGAGEVGPGQVMAYLLDRGGARADARLDLVVGDLRLPRTLTALLVGAALGVAGCLLQAVTRNPLAETGLLGVNAGASLGVVAGIAFLGAETGYAYLVCAFGGAVVASGLVLLIAGRGGGSPMRLVLAGSALGATFGGLTSVIVVNSAETYDRFRFWVLGSLAGVEGFGELKRLAPVLVAGFLVALLVARPLSALALGDDLARGLGHRPPVIRTVVAVGVTLLTAAAVALAGPISFLGLLAGFLARAVAGPRLSARLLLSGLIGAGVLTTADILARVVSRPFEAPVSVIVALIGAPVLIGIVRSRQFAALGLTEPATEDGPAGGGRPTALRRLTARCLPARFQPGRSLPARRGRPAATAAVVKASGVEASGAGAPGVEAPGAEAKPDAAVPGLVTPVVGATSCVEAPGTEASGTEALGGATPGVGARAVQASGGAVPARETPDAVRPPDSLLLRRGPLSLLVPRRAAVAVLMLAALLTATVVLSAYAGQSDMSVSRTFRAVFGYGDHFDVLLVQEFRLGRIVAGLAAGAALGLAGCLTQTLARNRLATPELLGVNDGATAAVLLSVSLSASGTFGAWWAGPLGALAAVLVVTTVSGGLGQRGYRVLVVGMAMSALASAATQVVLSRRSLNSASSLYVWTSGSLNGRGYGVAGPVLIGLAVLVPLTLAVARNLGVLRFDDATSASLGVNPGRTRTICLALAVALAGLAVGICGPVGFVALASPVIASRLAGPLRVPVIGSMLVGATLVVLADTLGRIAFDGVEIPVGVVTTVLGGPFLLWVLLGRSAATRV
ncbi:Fe(3+)-hydroxamate ABC transporter permease FhuB [Streptomyces sp. LX-29]|uniref:Fe(3+)-hydroxamate ABC transporter permease FhuB n=1 Tax=Streptomyces sp. LX-29 TaxID=2900152 RepID=UPI00240DF408|nr:Fe(3+)-hydroxamate ABC transporter permease FhuB [Streptomyces sp. LX-29]WFB06237.1 Fe(3+)-hydroxamate ABC transporter permease FhuB [Streptomyces sp. LX-29]